MTKEKLGGLTGSERVKAKKRGRPKKSETPDKSALENLQQATKTVTDVVGSVVDGVQTVTNAGKQVRRAFNGGSNLVSGDSLEATQQAQELASSYGLQIDDIANTIGGSNFEIDESIPEMDAKEANKLTLRMERQNNALDVAYVRINQKKKQIRNHKGEWENIGDLVDLDTTKINVGTKVIKHEIAATKFQIEQSKLEETEELLEQQVIKTQGVISLTDGIRTEWDLRLEKQQRQLEKLQIEIEQVDNDNARQREKLESFLFTE
ncbi:MAG: hypothetical protein HC836_44730 [Richelia sp. RM2_1_2]|nr:hypothetical protein [Richelia sp. SM2_1_7]NJO64972.1 hypothetical protein [Richelia sp. RM2_1_2]